MHPSPGALTAIAFIVAVTISLTIGSCRKRTDALPSLRSEVFSAVITSRLR